MDYWRKVWRQAKRSYWHRFPDWRASAMKMLIQFGVFFFVLWMTPWFGSLADEIKIGVVGLLSIVGSLTITFLMDLIAAPTQIDSNQVYEINSLRTAIRKAAEIDKASRLMSALWKEGRSLDTDDKRAAWLEKARAKVIAEFDAQSEHRFEVAANEFGFQGGLDAVSDLAKNAGLYYRSEILGNPLVMESLAWKKNQGEAYTDNTETWSDLDARPQDSPSEGQN